MILHLVAAVLAILQTATADPACRADVVFCIDNSGSIGNSDPQGGRTWQLVLDFTKRVIKEMNVHETMTHVGLVDFDDDARVDFVLETYPTESAVLSAVAALEHRGGFTNIARAIYWARQVLTRPEHGARPGVPKVIVLVSDGNANVAVEDLKGELDGTKALGIRIVTVGVTSAANETQLRSIASSVNDFVQLGSQNSAVRVGSLLIQQCPIIEPAAPNTTPSSVSGAAGAVYTRWGSAECPAAAKVVYKGFVGGSHYSQVGSGHEYLCMPEAPHWGKTVTGDQGWTGYIYGTEYELAGDYNKDKSPFSFEFNSGASIHNNDVPCAVCVNPNSYVSLMIPATQDCSKFNWNHEYTGYLASTDKTYYGREYLCVDAAPQVIQGGAPDLNGALFFPVQARCGSLPCPAYVEWWELTCSVCSK